MKIVLLFILTSYLNHYAIADETYGLIMIVKGTVHIVKNSEAPIEAKIGGKVYPLDTIITGKDSRAKIVMSDRNIINILPDTKLRIDQYVSSLKEKNVRLSLMQGKVRTNVEQKYDANNNKFEIKTPSAVAGVRGTQFITGYNKVTNTSEVTTLRGEVTFQGLDIKSNKLSESIIVKKGETSDNQDGRTPASPVKMSPAEINKIEKESSVSKNNDSTGIQQVSVPRNDIKQITQVNERNDNLLGDSAKNIINKPATVNIIVQ